MGMPLVLFASFLNRTNKRFLYQYKWFLRLKKFLKPSLFPSLNHLIELFAQHNDDVNFIQVGANKMEYTDPLFAFIQLNQWNGILVEPQKDLYDHLVRKFDKTSRIQLENTAISDQEGLKLFYYLSPKSEEITLPNWIDQLNSFHKETLETVLEKLPSAKISHSNIATTTIQQLAKKYKIKKLDLLMIDTEGHDFVIISSLDFDMIQPSLILYEHCFLSATDDQACIELLRGKGYFLFREKFNTIAFKSTEIYDVYKDYLLE